MNLTRDIRNYYDNVTLLKCSNHGSVFSPKVAEVSLLEQASYS
jgi:hypothetical protein